MAIGAICGWSTYTGPPPPERPRCGEGHRERYMDYRKRGFNEHGGFRCGKCGASMTMQESLDAPHNAPWRENMETFERMLKEETGNVNETILE